MSNPHRWVSWGARPNDLIGGWCLSEAEDPRTPAEGALVIADFCRQEDAEHIARLHNEWLAKILGA